MMRVFLAALLIICIPEVAGQHKVRTNRVWTLSIKTQGCNVTIYHAMSGLWDYENGKVLNSRQASTNLTMFQWSIDFPYNANGTINTNYRVADFAAEMSQTIYTYDVYGVMDKTKPVLYRFWISPIGASNKKIPPAPLRQFVNGDFDADDQAMLTRWFLLNHKWTSKNIWKDFDNLATRFDANSTIAITIKAPSCASKSIASHSGFAVREVEQ